MLKRNKRFFLTLLTLALPFGCVGCVSDGGSATYEQISGAEAKALMDSESGYIIIDARTQSEYDEGHIPGAILIPEYEIADRAEKELPDKKQLILVYCRSGRRSKIAAEAVRDLSLWPAVAPPPAYESSARNSSELGRCQPSGHIPRTGYVGVQSLSSPHPFPFVLYTPALSIAPDQEYRRPYISQFSLTLL